MMYADIDPMDIDPDTGRPYANYSSPALDTSFHDNEMDVEAKDGSWPQEFRFGKWTISYDPPPIPTRNCDWHYVHEDDDGAPDGSAARSGSAASAQACLDEIAELVAEMCHPIPPEPQKGQPCTHGHFGCSECSV